jgi:hypothetical protein
MRSIKLTMGLSSVLCALIVGCSGGADDRASDFGASESALILPNNQEFANPTGRSASFSTAGSVDLDGTFFQSLGSNGRSCGTCHLPSDGLTVSAGSAQAIFEQSAGLAPLFEFDGQNCPGADRSTVEARRSASSLMLDRAVVRFNRALPPGAEFEIVAFEGTYCNPIDSTNLIVFRRPLPTTNFGALGTVLWDGLGNAIAPTPHDAIGLVAIGATLLHAQTSVVPSPAQVAEMVGVMESLTTAQTFDNAAKDLTARDALGGPENLASLPLGGAPGFTIYDTWTDVPGGGIEAARRSVARGQAIFDSRPIAITGVGGLADRTGTCAGCHRVPNMGNTSGLSVLDIGISDASRRPADLPLYTLRNIATGATRQSSDPGRALVTGAWVDIGKFKVPNLRALSARAPYFHNGLAPTLDAVVDFYNARFNMGLTAAEHADLVNFLTVL